MVTIDQVRTLLVGQLIRITAVGLDNKAKPSTGKCVAVHELSSDPVRVDIELEDETRSSFYPETAGDNYITGPIWQGQSQTRTARVLQ